MMTWRVRTGAGGRTISTAAMRLLLLLRVTTSHSLKPPLQKQRRQHLAATGATAASGTTGRLMPRQQQQQWPRLMGMRRSTLLPMQLALTAAAFLATWGFVVQGYILSTLMLQGGPAMPAA